MNAPELLDIDSSLSGYSETEDYFATSFGQDGLKLLSVQMKFGVLVRTVRIPDPDKPTETNRRVSKAHAKRFGDYVINAKHPYVPPIVLWTAPDNVELQPLKELEDGTRFVMARFDKLGAADRDILDGQHRILGVSLKLDELRDALKRARERLANAEHLEDANSVELYKDRIRHLKDDMSKASALTVTVQILLTGDSSLVKQVFADVADNAKGINKSVLTNFDTRSVFNRVASRLAETKLDGVVDWEKSRVSKTSRFWLTLNDVSRVAQALSMPYGRRWSAKSDSEFKDKKVESDAESFFTSLSVRGEVGDMLTSSMIPSVMRKPQGPDASLLGSTTIIRVLAHAARELVVDNGTSVMSWDGFDEFVASLPMEAGYGETLKSGEPDPDSRRLDDFWFKTDKFDTPWVAPTARAQDIKALIAHVVQAGTAWMSSQ